MDSKIPFTARAPPGKGYHVWAVRMKADLEANDLWEAVETHLKANDLWDAVEEDYEVHSLSINPTMTQIKNHKERKSRKSNARVTLSVLKKILIPVSERFEATIFSLENAKDLLKSLSTRKAIETSTQAIEKLQAMVQDLKKNDAELKLILEMHRREFTDSRDVLETRDSDYKEWARVQSLKSRLDEQYLKLCVKKANEAEAISQQRLAAAEAEITDLRQTSEASKRNKTQNQQLLLQITERDDYNIKHVLECAKAKQLQDTLLLEKHNMEKKIQQSSASLNFYEMKVAKMEDQLRCWSDQVHKLEEEKSQKSVSLENTQKLLSDVRNSSHQARESQSKIEKSEVALADLQIELEKEG
ncbi:E3 ubiquitin-protein ligase BRE1-like 1 [Gossypium hirsutum]|uniref:E3 ubiquitin protein ligase n=1 Tax=Gossypium hirsutum TaxID=3635 RepID=A0A1U8M7N0_GOSHI|nr:E3 ubiquitin-protein ligase BRE1-like 1 [Gossypium hirsutum]